jgi:DNA-binding response OmpR family regulator
VSAENLLAAGDGRDAMSAVGRDSRTSPHAGRHLKRVLVVEDEVDVARLIKHTLDRSGELDVEIALTGEAALTMATEHPPDLVVLDLNLPGFDGLEICRILRARPASAAVPIIIVTARASESDRIRGLDLGADDYITKPFSPKEVVARVRAVFRRMENYSATAPEILHAADLTLDLPRLRVTAEGREIEELTPTEFALLAQMARSPGRVFTRAQLLDAVHGVAFESYERAIDAHIKNIRHKIEPNPPAPRYILTVYGVGYKFTDR